MSTTDTASTSTIDESGGSASIGPGSAKKAPRTPWCRNRSTSHVLAHNRNHALLRDFGEALDEA